MRVFVMIGFGWIEDRVEEVEEKSASVSPECQVSGHVLYFRDRKN